MYRPQPFWIFKGVLLGIAAVERRRALVPGPVDLVPPAASVFLGGPLARWVARFKLPRVEPS